MSLDVYLEGPPTTRECDCPRCGNQHTTEVKEVLYENNITHNLGKMAREAGLYEVLWDPDEGSIACNLIPKLKAGLELLKSDPEKFKKLNPPNGWGTYESLVSFVGSYLRACEENPSAKVSVWK